MKQFQTMIGNRLQEGLGDLYVVKPVTTLKNNSITLYGLQIEKKNENTIQPVIYLEDIKEEYENGISLNSLVNRMLCDIRREKFTDKFSADNVSDLVMDYEMVRKKIYCKLINTKANPELLKNVLSFPFLDLSVIFFVELTKEENIKSIIQVTKELQKKWHVDSSQIYADALDNMGSGVLQKMEDIMMEICEDLFDEHNQEEMQEIRHSEGKELRMYVLGNRDKLFGAANILRLGHIGELAEEHDLLILPSSIHECIIMIDDNKKINYKEYAEMVQDINNSIVATEERLSNSVYRYDRKTGEISIAYLGDDLF